MRSSSLLRGAVGLGTLALAACSNDIDTSHTPPPRGSIGTEVYGIFCDRVAAQALREDLNGSSFHGVCHKVDGQFAPAVDETKLPPITSDAVDVNGQPVSLDKQKADRAHALARIGALVRRRDDLIAALDATFPDEKVGIKDLQNPDPQKSCNAPMASGEDKLGPQMAALMGRFMTLYDDGTIPQSTESLAELTRAIEASPDTQAALARFGSRQGYRPVEVALGATRPMMAYPQLRNLANATLRLVSSDSSPYDPNPPLDANGKRIPQPGSAYPAFSQTLTVLEQEFRTKTADTPLTPLAITPDPLLGRDVLSRPRDNLEALQTIMYAEDPVYGGGDSRYIVLRDHRGYAKVALQNGQLPAPFVDKDKDGLADVDPLGQFVSSSGMAPPSPFFAVGAVDTPTRDMMGRALVTTGGPTLYEYLDTSHTFTASLLADLPPLVNPDPKANHETVMNALAGAYVLFGPRVSTQKAYPGDASNGNLTVNVPYVGYDTASSPLLDLVYATGQIMGDPSSDDTLALTSALMTGHTPELARTVGAALAFKTTADQHPEAKLPPKSTLWDEFLDVAVQIEKEPGLLEDVTRSLSSDQALPINGVFANYLQYRDHISYDRNDLNGKAWNFDTMSKNEMTTAVDRNKPDTGFNRSAMQRFLQAIHDVNGVTACNEEGAVLHAQGVPLLGSGDICAGTLALCSLPGTRPFHQCEVFKIENLAKFYLDSIIGKASFYLRPGVLRNGILGIGAATVDVMQQSSGINGFWDAGGSKSLRPTPFFLNRQVYFDVGADSPNPGDVNYTTNHFLKDLMGQNQIGTVVCPENVIPDPDPGAPDASKDGMVHGLRKCGPGDSVFERDLDATMVWENFGFYAAMAPLVQAFANHDREDLLLALMEVFYRHWGDGAALKQAGECDGQCTGDGVVTYEPLLSTALAGDMLPSLNPLVKALSGMTIAHCDAIDPGTHQCTATTPLSGVDVLAAAGRALLDPDKAKAQGLKNRAGVATSLRNDGTTNPQTTPVYLLLEALDEIDAAFAGYKPAGPGDDMRLTQWRSARSQLVDQFLGVSGTGTMSAFKEPGLPKITPVLVGMLRAQLLAHCPDSFTPPYKSCTWMKSELTNNMADSIKGPQFAAVLDVLDQIRRDDPARAELESLLGYLVDSASQNDALAALLATAADVLQVLRDDDNLVPLFHTLAPALSPSVRDDNGQYVKKSMADAQLALLSRVSGKYVDPNGTEICAKELDPNQILSVVLGHLVTPMKDGKGNPTQAPLEVILDVIADVNRGDPSQTNKLASDDYKSVAGNVSSFLLDKQSGLEQFYEVIRQGTQSE